MPTLQDVRTQWEPVLAGFGMTLEFAATDERQGYVALEDSDAEETSQRIAIVVEELRKYPTSFLRKSRLSILRMVRSDFGRGGGKYLILGTISLSYMPKIVHHEMMHILDTTTTIWGSPDSPHPQWKNREGFAYGPGQIDTTGFVSRYATTAYREDLADTAAWIWALTDKVLAKCETDPLLRAKCRAIVAWWSTEGLTRFNDLFDVPLPSEPKAPVVTERIAGNSRYDTAVEVSKIRFPTAASVVYLASATDFPDALVASTLSSDGPVLLVPSSGVVPVVVLAEVRRLQPDRVVAVGGTKAIPQETLDAVTAAARP